MSKYDDLFDATAPAGTIFADKGALDPLADPEEIHARDAQERALATILNRVSTPCRRRSRSPARRGRARRSPVV